jgi:GntR family transcriptional regulator/MocR family aminotransferase
MCSGMRVNARWRTAMRPDIRGCERHIRRVRVEYQRRRDTLVGLLRKLAPSALSFSIPAGGIALWVRADPEIDVDEWAARALSRGVAFQTARSFTFDRQPQPYARLGFASMNEAELRVAVGYLVEALKPAEEYVR